MGILSISFVFMHMCSPLISALTFIPEPSIKLELITHSSSLIFAIAPIVPFQQNSENSPFLSYTQSLYSQDVVQIKNIIESISLSFRKRVFQ